MASLILPERALIFRIVHIDNVEWTLRNGLHCRNSRLKQPDYREIGNPELIAKRADRDVPIPPGGRLSDYIPFYFTPYSPMLLNIKTGYSGIRQVPLDDVVIFVTSLPRLVDKRIPFVFTDRHAYLRAAKFFADLADLHHIDWHILQNRDFKRDPQDLGKMERYQAEALVYRHLPCDALAGIVCRTDSAVGRVEAAADRAAITTRVILKPGYYV